MKKATFSYIWRTVLAVLFIGIIFGGCSKTDEKIDALTKEIQRSNELKEKEQNEKEQNKNKEAEKKVEQEQKTETQDLDTKKMNSASGMQNVIDKFGEKPGLMDDECPFGIYDNGTGCGYTIWFNPWVIKPADTKLSGAAGVRWLPGKEGIELEAYYEKSPFDERCNGLKYTPMETGPKGKMPVPSRGYYTVGFNSSAHDGYQKGNVEVKTENGKEYLCCTMLAIGMCGKDRACPIMWFNFVVKQANNANEYWVPHWFTKTYGTNLINKQEVPFWPIGTRGYPNYKRAMLDEVELSKN